MPTEKFGLAFPPTEDRQSSRLDSIPREKPVAVPEAVQFSREIRSALNDTLEQEGWPENPGNFTSAEGFFEAAHDAVTERWNKIITTLLQEKAAGWIGQIEASGSNQNASEIIALLQNPAELEAKMQIRQFGVLEPLRTVCPEAWRALVLASSERQLAAVATAREWLKHIDEDILKETGLSKAEYDIFVDIAAITGKYLDHAYVRQIELADTRGGSSPTVLSGKPGEGQGVKYLYDMSVFEDSDELDIRTYSEMFPYEWPKIEERFRKTAEKIKRLLTEGKLPPVYNRFASYLEKMASTYGSDTKDSHLLHTEWQELMAEMRELALEGCPIMLVPQGCPAVAGDASKVDVEMRMGLRSKEAAHIEETYGYFQGVAQDLIQRYGGENTVPPLIVNYQPFSFGPNLYWMTRGESDDEKIVSHVNAVREIAVTKEIPLMQGKFVNFSVDEAAYVQASVGETATHEFAHSVLSSHNKKTMERLGISNYAQTIEELKAVTVSTQLIMKAYDAGKLPPGINLDVQCKAKLGAVTDYLKNKSNEVGTSGERYYTSGVMVVDRLLQKGLLKRQPDGRYEVGDSVEILRTVAEIGEEVLMLMSSEKTTPQTVESYIESIYLKKDSEDVKQLISDLKS